MSPLSPFFNNKLAILKQIPIFQGLNWFQLNRVSRHVEITMAGTIEQDRLVLTALFTFERFVDRGFYRMGRFGGNNNAFRPGKGLGSLEDFTLVIGYCTHYAIMHKTGDDR